MPRFTAFLLLLALLLALTACGQTPASAPPAEDPAPSAQDPAPPEEPEPEPEPGPYEILDPTVMPAGGSRDGVAYAAWDGIVEHLFFHPVVAYPELAFDGDSEADGIDDYMVTVGEYIKRSEEHTSELQSHLT